MTESHGDKIDAVFAKLGGELVRDLAAVLNRHSVENASDTPDFILAEYLVACLEAFATAVVDRGRWFADE